MREYKKAWKKANPLKHAAQTLKDNMKKRGVHLTSKEALLLVERIRNLEPCEICGNNSSDVDHYGDRVRGLLCHSCNLGLGAFRDNPRVLREAASYVERREGETA
jgi:hypothetical protein